MYSLYRNRLLITVLHKTHALRGFQLGTDDIVELSLSESENNSSWKLWILVDLTSSEITTS